MTLGPIWPRQGRHHSSPPHPLSARSGADAAARANRQLADRPRNGDEEALRETDAELAEPPHHVAALDALGDRFDVESAGDTRDRLDDALVRGGAQHVAHEMAVDLHVVD